MEPVEYEIELERTNGPADHTSASLPSLTKGQRLKVPEFGLQTTATHLDTSLGFAAHEDLNASSEMVREDRGDAIPSIRSNTSCGIVIRSSAAFAPDASIDSNSASRPRRSRAGPCGSTTPPSGCPPDNETTLHRMSSPPARSMAVVKPCGRCAILRTPVIVARPAYPCHRSLNPRLPPLRRAGTAGGVRLLRSTHRRQGAREPELVELQTLFLRAARIIGDRSLDLSMPVRELIARKMENTGVPTQRTAAIRGFIPVGRSDRASASHDHRHHRIRRDRHRLRTDAMAGTVIADDWGLDPLDAAARHDLLEILEERYARRSIIVTSQIPVDRWHQLIGEPTYADAIMDRLVNNAHRIDLSGESLRRTKPMQGKKRSAQARLWT
jgi:IstB-like ATP binding protein